MLWSDYLFQLFDVACNLFVRNFVVEQVAGKVLGICCHVDETVAGEVEQDNLLFAGLLAFFCLGNGGGNGMARFGSRDDTLCIGVYVSHFLKPVIC